jgi:hypothetical protein
MKGISLKDHSNCWIIEEKVAHWGKIIDNEKLFLLSSMLDEFCEEETSPYLVKYTDYRILRYKKFILVETAFKDEGIQLENLSKFELAIFFKDMRSHFQNMILTLAYLKVRLVSKSDWLIHQNVVFDFDSLSIKFCGYVVVDILKETNKMKKNERRKEYGVKTKSSGKTQSTYGKFFNSRLDSNKFSSI